METLARYKNSSIEINELIKMGKGNMTLILNIPESSEKAFLTLISALKEKSGVDPSLLAEKLTEAVKTL